MAIKHILIADDHPLFHEALEGVVQDLLSGTAQCVCTITMQETLQALADGPAFDLILLDLKLPGADGFSCLCAVRDAVPSVPVVIVSSADQMEIVRESFTYGAMGYLPKSSSHDVMKNAIRLVMSGNSYIPAEALGPVGNGPKQESRPVEFSGDGKSGDDEKSNLSALTPRQCAVLELLAQGKANKIIAYELEISEITVKAHVSAILRKLKVSNRLQAVIAAKDMTS